MQRRGYLDTGSQCLSGRQVCRRIWWYHFAKGSNKDITSILKKTYNLRRRRVTAKVPRDFYIRQLKCMQRGLTRQYHRPTWDIFAMGKKRTTLTRHTALLLSSEASTEEYIPNLKYIYIGRILPSMPSSRNARYLPTPINHPTIIRSCSQR